MASVDIDFARIIGSFQGTDSVIDNWEDGDKDEYTGDTDSVKVQGAIVSDGEKAAKLSGDSVLIYSQEGSGLLNYPQSGDTFAWDHYLTQGSEALFLYGVQDNDNYYAVKTDATSGDVIFDKVSGGTSSTLKSVTPSSLPTGEWITYFVEWGVNGTHKIQLEDSASNVLTNFFVEDSDYTSGGIGWGETGFSPNDIQFDEGWETNDLYSFNSQFDEGWETNDLYSFNSQFDETWENNDLYSFQQQFDETWES